MNSGRTADRLYEAAISGDYLALTPGALVDFGIDRNSALFGEYQKAIIEKGVTADQLFDACRASQSGKALTELIGAEVITAYDFLSLDEDEE